MLGGANTYIGTTAINSGVLSLANSAALGGDGAIKFGGGTLQYTANNTQDYSGNIVSSSGPISIDTNGQNVNFGNVLTSSNSGGLTKIGSGLLTLNGSNTYSGPTVISGGTLQMGGLGVPVPNGNFAAPASAPIVSIITSPS